MYAYGIFFDRDGEKRIAVEVPDKTVVNIVVARVRGPDAFAARRDKIASKNILHSVVIDGLFNHIGNNGDIENPFICDMEEWFIGYARTAEDAKKAFVDAYVAADDDDDDDEWDEC